MRAGFRWYVPSWNGDLRLVAGRDNTTVLTIEDPTPDEEQVLARLGVLFLEQGFVDEWTTKKKGFFSRKTEERVINAPIEKIGPLVVATMRPGPAVLTAITLKGGQVLTTSGSTEELSTLVESLGPYRTPAKVDPPAPAPADKPKTEDKPKKDEPKAAATVRRPTPSCPQCEPGAIQPASEVLLSFLNEEEHESWAKSRCLVVEGGMSGHRYLLAHRNTMLAARIGRVCYDLDARCVVHFHDRRVPPEEEILAAKLILQHRESWLRNEATMFEAPPHVLRFKNPFGDGSDGIPDATFTRQLTMDAAKEVSLQLFRESARKFINGGYG